MTNIHTIFLFLFVFSWVGLIRLVVNAIVMILQNPPQKLNLQKNELFFYAILISYIITYIIQN
jgi:hypothetical protein